MRFIKYVLATIVGLFLFLFLIFGAMMLTGSVASRFSKVTIEPNTVLFTSFGNEIVEKTDKSPFGNFDPMTLRPQRKDGLHDRSN